MSAPSSIADALPSELLARIRAIHIRTKRLVTDALAGEYQSAFKGRGMEFEETRAYVPGDDIRHIDWKVTARTTEPHVKVHREERELTVMLMVDVSSSGNFGTKDKTKNEVAAEIAAVLAFTAIRKNDRVGLIIFSDTVEHYIPPKKGRAHVWNVIRDILTHKAEHRATNLEEAFDFLGKVLKQRAVCFLVSDFTGFTETDALHIAGRKHDLTAVSIRDRRERELPNVGLVELEDAETGERMLVDTSDGDIRKLFEKHMEREQRQLDDTLKKSQVGHVRVDTSKPWIDSIAQYFRQRERGR